MYLHILAILFCNEVFSLSLIRFFSKTHLKTFTEHLARTVHPGDVPAAAPALVDPDGTIKTLAGTDICAMVLASGQFMFSCDCTGSYARNVPLDTTGKFKLQVCADGFASTIQVYDEFSLVNDVRVEKSGRPQAHRFGSVEGTSVRHLRTLQGQEKRSFFDLFARCRSQQLWRIAKTLKGGQLPEERPAFLPNIRFV